MKPTQAEVLLRIAENTFADGDEVMAEMRRQMSLHARRILDDEELLKRAWEQNQQDKERFAAYMPRLNRQESQQERPAVQQQMAERTRAALTQIKKVESDGNQQRSTSDRQAQTGG